jgi:hypothetical protein
MEDININWGIVMIALEAAIYDIKRQDSEGFEYTITALEIERSKVARILKTFKWTEEQL